MCGVAQSKNKDLFSIFPLGLCLMTIIALAPHKVKLCAKPDRKARICTSLMQMNVNAMIMK